MGIGRREFLKFAAAALAGVATGLIRAATVNGDYYVNSQLGLGFIKPRGWQFEALKDFGPLLEGQILSKLKPEAAAEQSAEHTSTLVAAISKYRGEEPRFSPSITVFKNEEDVTPTDRKDPERMLWLGMAGFATVLKDYWVIEEPTQRRLSNCEAWRFKARWIFEHAQISPVVIEDETWVIDQGTALYTIHLYDAPSVGDVAPREFQEFTQSLRLA